MAPAFFNNQCKRYVVFQVKDGLGYFKKLNYKNSKIRRKQFSYRDAYQAFNKQRHDLGEATEESIQ